MEKNKNYSHTDVNKSIVEEPIGKWSGPWTLEKLDAFEKYVRAYLQIMKKYAPRFGWRLFYFDAFAGSGDTGVNHQEELDTEFGIFSKEDFDQVEEIIKHSNYKGAAERVLTAEVDGYSFDFFYFIDLNSGSLKKLEKKLNSQFPERKNSMAFREGDANEQLRTLVDYFGKHPDNAALVLLDPFGMQIDWSTLEALMSIKHIDLWILLPSGVIINRLLTRKKGLMLPDKLSSFYGMKPDEIKNYFYTERKQATLFGEETTFEKCNDAINKIAQLYVDRLKTGFEYVTEEPLVLKNSTNCPIFHFIFASHNKTAKSIASQIVDKKNKKK